ncbi:MAG: dinitrogenase iron-molybdenum cofactor [Clostridiaceae bacterium]|nr:dinitrogenase iron-molybdenum cofactor [Clostridiaceae bacterium]
MKKIGVACDDGEVSNYFGHCEKFIIFDTVNKHIIKSKAINNPGHKPVFLPNFLDDLGVNVVISGGMGGGAIEIFNEKNIEVVIGASGEAKEAAESYLEGSLESVGSPCLVHRHQN